MPRLSRLPRKTAAALVLVAVLFTVLGGSHQPGRQGRQPSHQSASGRPIAARTLAATTSAGGPCSVPGIGDIGGLLGFCSLGSSGLTGDLNNLCQPGVPEPEPATSGLDALIKPPVTAGKMLATPYNQYGMSGQFWAATNLQCSDMTSLIGNDAAGMMFDFAKAMDRVTITVYQSAAGEGILGWLQGVTDRLISGLGKAIYFPYLAVVVILAAIWLAWQGLIRKRGTRTIEGTIWIVVACAAAIWLIGRPADFTGLGKGVSDGISTTLNTAFAHLPSPGQASCLPVGHGDPQISPASYSYTSGGTVVDQNANELWTVLVCKPWLDGEFGTTTFAQPGAQATPVNTYARQLLWAQAIAANEQPTTALVQAKQAAYAGIAKTIEQQNPGIYPLFQGKQWTTRLEIAFAALLAAVVAGVLVLLISVTLILLKLGFLLLLIVGPFFLLVGTHPGFGRVVAVRWFEMLVGVLLKQAAVALALSVLLYCYALIMGTTDAVLPWALKILMITLVTVAVFIYRKPFQHLFTAVGYGAIGSTDRAEADLSRAAATARANTRTAATIGVPGFAAYRAARWARRNPAQAAGLALGAATAVGTGSMASGLGAGGDKSGIDVGGDGHEFASDGTMSGAGGQSDSAGVASQVSSRARAWGASAGATSGSEAPPLRLPNGQGAPNGHGAPTGTGARIGQGTPASWPQNGSSAGQPPAIRLGAGSGAGAAAGSGPRSGPGAGSGSGAAGSGPGRPAASGSYPVVPPARPSGGSRPADPGPARPGRPPAPPAWSGNGSASAPRPAAPQRPAAQPAQPRPAAPPSSPAPSAPRSSSQRPAASPSSRRRSAAPPLQPSRQSPAEQPRPVSPDRPARSARPGRPARQAGQPRSDRAAGGRSDEAPASWSQSGQGDGLGDWGGQPGAFDSPENSPFWLRPFWRRK